MGGGIASSIARALAHAAATEPIRWLWHAVVMALSFGLCFTLALLLGGRWLYGDMGGTGARAGRGAPSSSWVFAGACWCGCSTRLLGHHPRHRQHVGAGQCDGGGRGVPDPGLAALDLRLGGRFRAWASPAGAMALLLYYLLGSIALHRLPALAAQPAQADAGGAEATLAAVTRHPARGAGRATVSTVATANLSISIATGLTGRFGAVRWPATARPLRLERCTCWCRWCSAWAPHLVAMVGTCHGRGPAQRPGVRRKPPGAGAALAFGLTETIDLARGCSRGRGCCCSATTHDAMLETGAHYCAWSGRSTV